MSHIYFHTPTATAEIRGSERVYMDWFMDGLTLAILDPERNAEKLRPIIPQPSYLTSSRYATAESWADGFTTWFRVGSQKLLLPGGEITNRFTLSLNTAYKLGGDPLKFFARLHGQCEIHCYVEGPNRRWLADIVEDGLAIGLYRADMGWPDLIAFLKQSDTEPVVCSYSVCDSFPNRSIAEIDDEPWYAITDDDRWQAAMSRLRETPSGLEIKPDNWQTFYFNDGLTAFDLLNRL